MVYNEDSREFYEEKNLKIIDVLDINYPKSNYVMQINNSIKVLHKLIST